MVQPIRDLGWRHGARTRRGQLDGERHAVQGAGDPADGNDVGLVEDGSRSSRAGPLHEQLGGRIREDLIRGRVLGGSRERPHVDLDLVGDGERFAAGGQDRDVGAAAQDVVGQSRGRIDDVFAVVEEEQQPPVGEVAVEPLADVTLGGGTVHRHAERVRDRDRNLISRVHRRQPYPEGTVREVRQRLDGEREREGSLAGATRPDEGQQPDAGQESPERLEQLLAPDERPHDSRQVRGHRGGRTPTVPRRAVGSGLHAAPRGRSWGAHWHGQLGLRTERLVLAQHPFLQRPQGDRWFETQLLVQGLAGPGVHLERIGLSTTAVESHHQQTSQGLQGRVAADDGFEVVHDLVVTPQRERGLRAFGERSDAQRVETRSLADGPLLGVEVAEGLSTP